MSGRVNLLLLLSALLSALTGVGTGVRAQDRAQAVAEGSVVAARVAIVPRPVAQRPMVALPMLVAVAGSGHQIALIVAPVAPAYATRRRE